MNKWVCKECDLYQKVNPNVIKAGCRVYFYKNKNLADQVIDQINVVAIKGVVLRRNDDFIFILTSAGVSKVKATDGYLEDAPTNLVYNMFRACNY